MPGLSLVGKLGESLVEKGAGKVLGSFGVKSAEKAAAGTVEKSAGRAATKEAGSIAEKDLAKTAGKTAEKDAASAAEKDSAKSFGSKVRKSLMTSARLGGTGLKGAAKSVKHLFTSKGNWALKGLLAAAVPVGGFLVTKSGQSMKAAGAFGSDIVHGRGLKIAGMDARAAFSGRMTTSQAAKMSNARMSMAQGANTLAAGGSLDSLGPEQWTQMSALGNTQMTRQLGYSPSMMAAGTAGATAGMNAPGVQTSKGLRSMMSPSKGMSVDSAAYAPGSSLSPETSGSDHHLVRNALLAGGTALAGVAGYEALLGKSGGKSASMGATQSSSKSASTEHAPAHSSSMKAGSLSNDGKPMEVTAQAEPRSMGDQLMSSEKSMLGTVLGGANKVPGNPVAGMVDAVPDGFGSAAKDAKDHGDDDASSLDAAHKAAEIGSFIF